MGVASSALSRFKHTNYIILAAVSVIFFTACFYNVATIQFPTQQQNALSSGTISAYLTSSIGQLYMIALVLFGVALSSIVLLKKINRIK